MSADDDATRIDPTHLAIVITSLACMLAAALTGAGWLLFTGEVPWPWLCSITFVTLAGCAVLTGAGLLFRARRP